MRKHRLLGFVTALTAGLALVGTGFSVFYFTSGLASVSIGEESGVDVNVVGLAEKGSLSVSCVTEEENSSNETAGSNYVIVDPTYLIVMQERVYFNFTHFALTYTPPQGDSSVSISIVFQAEMVFDDAGSMKDYFTTGSWMPEASTSDIVFQYEMGPEVISLGSEKTFYLPVPTLEYIDGKVPNKAHDVFAIKDALSDEKVQFYFKVIQKGQI